MILTVKAAVRKRCPYKDEIDLGTAALTFDITEGDGPELHGLAAALAEFPDQQISHENYTRDLLDAWSAVGLVRVETTWLTAGLEVEVMAGDPCSTSRTPAPPACVTP